MHPSNQDHRFHRLARNVPGVVYECHLTDGGASVDYLSPQVEACTGYGAEEFLSGRLSPQDLFHPDDRERVLAELTEAVKAGRTGYEFTYRIVRKDGAIVWLLDRASIRKAPGGLFTEGLLIDITAQKNAEQALIDSERHFRAIFEDAPTAFWLEDYSEVRAYLEDLKRERGPGSPVAYLQTHPEALKKCASLLRVVDVNPAAARMFEARSKDELLFGTRAPFQPKTYDLFLGTLRALLEGQRSFSGAFSLHTMRGRPIEILASWSAMEPDYSRVVASMTDITAQSITRSRLARLNELLMTRSASAEENLGRLTALLGEALPADFVLRLRLGDGVLSAQDAWHPPEGYQGSSEADCPFWEHLLKTDGKTPLSIPDVARDARSPAFERILAWGFRSYFGFLIKSGGKPVGSLCTFHRQPFYPTEEDVRFIGILASAAGMEEGRRELEERYLHAQKLEAVGRLAGGVAHDFNNTLTAVKGYADLLVTTFAEGDPRREDAEEILAAAERATALTRQLLAFGRRQVLNPAILNVQSVLGALAGMLRKLLGEDVVLELRMPRAPVKIEVDQGQFEQVLLNLSVNARDAMPRGGTLTLTLDVVSLADPKSLPPGDYASITVSDTGIGMSADILSRLYEPFFTTKERGKGTGLGLSTAYGIIKQSGGEMRVQSEPGKGSLFQILLPVCRREKPPTKPPTRPKASPKGTETILVVEDEGPVRALAERILSARGYHVLCAQDGEAALAHLQEAGRSVRLLVTDMVMPGMDGRTLAKKAAALNPRLRVLFVSGYSDETVFQPGFPEPGMELLMKPFTPETLSRKVREVLDKP